MLVKNKLPFNEDMVIYQDSDYQSFTLDSLLLAKFVTLNHKVNNVIDLCAGNIPVALYLSHLSNTVNIVSVELQEVPCQSAKLSIKENNLEDRLTILNEDVNGITDKIKTKFDLVTCNPPYFKYDEDTNIKDNEALTIARFEKHLLLDDLLKESHKLLKDNGYFAIVYRPDRLTDLLSLMRSNGLEPKRIRFVRPKIEKEPRHVLVEGRRSINTGSLKILPDLIIYNEDGTYTKEALEIYEK